MLDKLEEGSPKISWTW